ncbi:hypothetical protein FRC17_003054 [Serendipita sp. 399]|nr:hypothetical protein FRC17_003054 [Serendipita sp. 399]
MSSYSGDENVETVKTTTTTTVTEESHKELGVAFAQLSQKTRMISDSKAFDDIRSQNEDLSKKCAELSKEKAELEAKLYLAEAKAKTDQRDVERLRNEIKQKEEDVKIAGAEKEKLYVDFTVAKSSATSAQEAYAKESRRVTLMKEENGLVTAEYLEFKKTILELLGIDKKKMSTMSTTELIKFLRAEHSGGVSADLQRENARLERENSDLKARLAVAGDKPAPTVDGTIITKLSDEKNQLNLQVQEERHKYSTLLSKTTIYRDEAESESARLTKQLEAAYAELEEVQSNLETILNLSGSALKSSTSAYTKVGGVKYHKCKTATSIVEHHHERTTSESHRLSASFSSSGSEHFSSSPH